MGEKFGKWGSGDRVGVKGQCGADVFEREEMRERAVLALYKSAGWCIRSIAIGIGMSQKKVEEILEKYEYR